MCPKTSEAEQTTDHVTLLRLHIYYLSSHPLLPPPPSAPPPEAFVNLYAPANIIDLANIYAKEPNPSFSISIQQTCLSNLKGRLYISKI